jgi:streptogramin lyase
VDSKGNVVVSAVVSATAAPAAQSSSGTSSGVVAVFNGGTKKLESVKQVDVAPQTFVLEPNGRRALLISTSATTLVDASTYLPLATRPGGVAAAFAVTGDDFAILSAGITGATVSFARRADSILVGGTARGIAALPDGGFAVLSDSDGRGRITLLLPDGTTNGSIEVAADGRDLAYDPVTRLFTVIGTKVSRVALPASLAVLPSPVQNPTSTSTALPTVAASPTPSATPTPSGASPTPKPTIAAPVAETPERANGPVPAGARLLWASTYFVSGGARVNASASDGTRIWYVDDANRLNTFNMTTGERYRLAQLPAGANVTRIVVSPNHVYLADSAGTLHVETIDTEQLNSYLLPLLSSATAIAASPDERIWLATDRAGLVGFDPRTLRLQTIPAGPGLSAIASDSLGRIWVAAGERQAIDMYDPLSGSLTSTPFEHDGAVTALHVDRSGALTLGTDRGSVFVMRNGSAILAQAVGSKILDLVAGPGGPWYVAQGAGETISGPVGAPGPVRHVPASASRPFFDGSGRAWQADRSVAGFYVTLPEGPR